MSFVSIGYDLSALFQTQ